MVGLTEITEVSKEYFEEKVIVHLIIKNLRPGKEEV